MIVDVFSIEFLLDIIALVHLVPSHLGAVICIEIPGARSKVVSQVLLLLYLIQLLYQLLVIFHI